MLDFDDSESNHWLAVHQFDVVENKHNQWSDVTLVRQFLLRNSAVSTFYARERVEWF